MTPNEYTVLQITVKLVGPGNILVAGTWDGNDVRAILEADPTRNVIVIDSFMGLDIPAEQDFAEDMAQTGECNIGGLEAYLNTFKDTGIKPPTEIYDMWITKKSLQQIKKRPLALIFLDLDHYQPTKDCLERFSKWLIPNGIILVHDYDFVRCPGIKKCCDEFGGKWEKIPETGFAKYIPER